VPLPEAMGGDNGVIAMKLVDRDPMKAWAIAVMPVVVVVEVALSPLLILAYVFHGC